jgi:hypothetical protein
MQMKLWNSLFVASILVAPTIAAASPDKPNKPSATGITEIVLERVGGGPQWSGHGWSQDKIVLRPQAKANSYPPDEFRNLSQWLLKSGFFVRRSGYIASPLLRGDVGYLMITAARGSQRKQVYSYNGIRDAELWQTEMIVRGVAATRQLQAARSVWIKKHGKAEPGGASRQSRRRSQLPRLG